MVRLKVRPRVDASAAPCAAQLVTLLSCFATNGDLRASGMCAQNAKALAECVATTKRGGSQGAKGSINHLLGKLK